MGKNMNFSMQNNGRINIDGRSFTGRNISISNGKVTIDGIVQDGELVGDINITVEGDIEKLENATGLVKANNVGSISTLSGDVECGNVSGSVSTMSGDVDCGTIGGNVKTMSGDIKHK